MKVIRFIRSLVRWCWIKMVVTEVVELVGFRTCFEDIVRMRKKKELRMIFRFLFLVIG